MSNGFLIGAAFGVVSISCFIMTWVWAGVATERRLPLEPRFHVVAWSMALSSACLAGLTTNRAIEEIWGAGFAAPVLFLLLLGLGGAKVSIMSSSAIDGEGKLIMLFVGLSLLWVCICAWSKFA